MTRSTAMTTRPPAWLATFDPTMSDDISRLVLRHRDEPSPTLPVEWPLLRFLDAAGTDTLVTDLSAAGTAWEVYEATERLWEHLPASPGLYMFVWRPWFRFRIAQPSSSTSQLKPDAVSQILYIGQAGASDDKTGNTLKSRYKGYCRHIRADPHVLWSPTLRMTRPDLSRYLALRPLEYWFTEIHDRSQIKSLERRLINMFNPPINLRDLPKVRSHFRTAQPAFTP